MNELMIFLTSGSLLVAMLSAFSLFAVGVVVIWETLRPAVVQIWKWVRP